MQAKVRNDVANEFAKAFYTALCNEFPVDLAVKVARNAIVKLSEKSKPQALAFGVPVVYLNTYKRLVLRDVVPEGGGAAPVRMVQQAAAVATPTREPLLRICPVPSCEHVLVERARQRNACPRCSTLFRCVDPACGALLDDYEKDRFCGTCQAEVPRRVRHDDQVAAAQGLATGHPGQG